MTIILISNLSQNLLTKKRQRLYDSIPRIFSKSFKAKKDVDVKE